MVIIDGVKNSFTSRGRDQINHPILHCPKACARNLGPQN